MKACLGKLAMCVWAGVLLLTQPVLAAGICADIPDQKVLPGDSAEVSVEIADQTGLAAWMFEVSWDPAVLTLEPDSVAAGTPFAAGSILYREKEPGTLVVSWYHVRNAVGDGPLFTFRLKASDTADGRYPIQLTCVSENTLNEQEEEIPVQTVNGTLVVTEELEEVIPPEVDPDPEGPPVTPQKPMRPDTPKEPELPRPLPVFTDVHPGDYYNESVNWAVQQGITNGITQERFGPGITCTRAQAVTFLWRAAGSPKPISTINPFTDVGEDSYYRQAVIWAVENEITNGTTETTFSPNRTVTRAQTMTFLWRFSGAEKLAGALLFRDVPEDAYYTDAIRWALSRQITGGITADTFGPGQGCTRGQLVTFLYRAQTH